MNNDDVLKVFIGGQELQNVKILNDEIVRLEVPKCTNTMIECMRLSERHFYEGKILKLESSNKLDYSKSGFIIGKPANQTFWEL